MNKLLFTFLLLFLIFYSECSKCTDFKITTTENTKDTTTENTKDVTGGESETEGKTETEGETETGGDDGEGEDDGESRRRLVNEVTEKDCKGLETSDNNKYQCAVKSDHKGCEEVPKEGVNKLQISLSILFLLFLI